MTNDNLSIRDVINQSGGSMQISYGNFKVVAPTNDVHQGIALLKKTNDRAGVLESVKAAIDHSLPRLIDGTASQQEAMYCAQDITIWFANEVLEGRQSLEQKDLTFIPSRESGEIK